MKGRSAKVVCSFLSRCSRTPSDSNSLACGGRMYAMYTASTLMQCNVRINGATDCHTRATITAAHNGRPDLVEDLGEEQVCPFHMLHLHQPLLLEAWLLHPPCDVPEVEAGGQHRQLPGANACGAHCCVCTQAIQSHTHACTYIYIYTHIHTQV